MINQVHQALLQNSNNKTVNTTPQVKPQSQPQPETVKSGGIVKREIPIKNDVNFNTLPVQPAQAQQGYMQPQAPMVNGRFVDQNGRPIPVPNYGQAQVVGYANQQPVNQPMMQQPMMPMQPMMPPMVPQQMYQQPMMQPMLPPPGMYNAPQMQPGYYQQPVMPVQPVQPRNQQGYYPYGR